MTGSTNIISRSQYEMFTTKKHLLLLEFFIGIVFCFSPTCGTLLMLGIAFILNEKRLAIPTAIAVLAFIWCFQSTRSFSTIEPMDWAGNYYVNFSNVPNAPFFRYIFVEKEFVWQIINYIGYHIFNGHFLIYANFIVFLTFGFTALSLYKYWHYSKRELRFFVISMVILAFIPEMQMICNNLLRQQFAFSMMLYVIVEKVTTGKIGRLYILAAISILTHTMTFLFVPFLFLKLDKKLSLKGYIYVVVAFVILFALTKFLPFLSVVNVYGFQRLARASEYMGTDVMETTAIYPFLFIMAIYYVKAILIDKICEKNRIYFCNLMMTLLLLCLLMEAMPLMQVRYFIIRLFLIPFIVPYFFTRKGFFRNSYMLVISLFFIIRFFTRDYYWFDMDYFLSKDLFHLNLLNLF